MKHAFPRDSSLPLLGQKIRWTGLVARCARQSACVSVPSGGPRARTPRKKTDSELRIDPVDWPSLHMDVRSLVILERMNILCAPLFLTFASQKPSKVAAVWAWK